MSIEKRFRIAVRGLIYNEASKVLILKRSRPARGIEGIWELPGGGLDHGESVTKALEREIFEETQLNAIVKNPILVWDYCREDGVQIIGMTLKCQAVDNAVVLSDEHVAFAWVTLEELLTYEIFPELRDEISIFMKG